MSSVSIRKWTNPSEEEILLAAELLALAFFDDPFNQPTKSDGALSLNRAEMLAHIRTGLASGEVYVASVEPAASGSSATLDGVAIWYQPRTEYRSSAEQRNSLSEEGQAWMDGVFIPKFTQMRIDAGVSREHLRNAYHLVVFGVRASTQRKGVGAALLGHLVQMANVQKKDIVVESSTPHDRDFYKKAGFTQKSEVSITLLRGGVAPFYCLVHRPSPS